MTAAASAGESAATPSRAAGRVCLLGVAIDRVTAAAALDRIFAALDAGRGGWVVTPNLDILRRLVHDRAFADLCADADLRLADGMPLVWASRLKRDPLPERVAGSDLIWSVTKRAAERGRSVFLLGGNPGTAVAAAEELGRRYPGLRVAGTLCPPLGFEKDEAYMAGMVRDLVAAAPDIVLVALGSPKQERLTRELRAHLPRAWFLGIGISFSFVIGEVRRAPRWMQKIGLEWCHRLIQEPRRLFRRYLVDGLPFAARLLATSALSRTRADH